MKAEKRSEGSFDRRCPAGKQTIHRDGLCLGRALMILLAALVLAGLSFSLPAEAEMQDQTVIGVQWIDAGTGEMSEYAASRITEDGEEYWAYLPEGAFSGELVLRVCDYSGRYVFFSPEDGASLTGTADAGSGTENAPCIDIACIGAEGTVLAVKKLYLSTFPAPSAAAAVSDARVRVQYRDSVTGMELYESQTLNCAPSSEVPVCARMIEGYSVIGDEVRYVVTDAMGNPSPGEIVFTYMPLSQPVLAVYYLDEQGEQLRQADQVVCPLNDVVTVTCPEIEGYRAQDGQDVEVYVDRNGNMSQSEVIFRYSHLESPVISIYYLDAATGKELVPAGRITCPPGETVAVEAPEVAGYRVEGETVRTVSADRDGTVLSSSVTFSYLPVQPAVITVRAVDAETGMDLTAARQQSCEVGSEVVFYAEAISGYYVQGSGQETVSVGKDGVPDRNEVLFYYTRIREPVVNIRYLSAQTLESVAPDSSRSCPVGSVTVIDALPIDGYLVQGNASASVTVDESGRPDTTEVIFLYGVVSDPVVTVRYVSGSVLQQELIPSETVSCPLGQTTVIPAKQIDGYVPAGKDSVEVAVGAHGEMDTDTVTFYYNLVQAPIVAVRYLLEDGTEIAPSDRITCPVNQVSLISAENIAGYSVVGETVKTVSVDVNGIPDAKEIEFLYCKIGDAVIQIRYIDTQNNLDIFPSGQAICHLGANTRVTAMEIEGYTVVGQSSKYVYVDEYGKADVSEIVFAYEKKKTPETVLVPVVYRDLTSGLELYSSHELFETNSVNYISADKSVIPEDYEIVGAGEQQVVVDENGTPDPREIVFQLRETARIEKAIPVYYRTAEGEDVASPTFHDCVPGNNAVMAEPLDLKANYSLLGEDTQYVSMETDGTLSAGEVVFLYYLSVTPVPTPEPTAIPYAVENQDFYAHPSKNGIYFRSSPDTTSLGNVLMELSAGEVVHVKGLVINERGEYWYLVEAAGMEGFMNANVIQPMSQEEVNRVFGYTPTPVPTEIPDGVTIDRWGQVNSGQVALRTQPNTSGKIIDRIGSSAKLWVFQSVTDNGTQWYQVRYNGSDGYMMKKFVTLMGEVESMQYQSSLSTPMATKTPPATRMPTSVITPSPTPGPTSTPYYTPSPSPSPTQTVYVGYALTRAQSNLYKTGPENGEISVIEADQLVLIQSQTYDEDKGIYWDSVDVLATGEFGFMMDSDLEHINDKVASSYFIFKPALDPTAVPTDVPAQYNGYGITIGEHAVIRAYADTNAQIYNVLDKDTVVMVTGQEYSEGQAWDIVNYGSQWGYIREDQIRMLNTLEVEGYLSSLRTPTPLPEATPTAVAFSGSSLSSYGYVTASRVNLRSAATQTSSSIRMLEQYAFALVMETEQNDKGEVWYHVSQAGTEGYIRSDYFTVLTLDELSAFLTGDNYSLSGSNEGSTTDTSVSNLQAFEDYNTNVWQNPALSVSYAPFAVKTPEPDVTYLLTVSPTATASPTPMSTAGIGGWMNTNTPQAANTLPPSTAEPEKAPSGSGALGIALILGAAVIGGGGIYLYSIHRRNERRRRAVREQQARKNAGHEQFRQRPADRETGDYSARSMAADRNDWQRVSGPVYPPENGGMDVRSGAVPQGTIRVSRDSRGGRTETGAAPYAESGSRKDEMDMGATSQWRKPADRSMADSAAGYSGTENAQETTVLSESRERNETVRAAARDRIPGMDDTVYSQEKDPTRKVRPISGTSSPERQEPVPGDYAVNTAPAGESTGSSEGTPVRRRRSERHRNENGDNG